MPRGNLSDEFWQWIRSPSVVAGGSRSSQPARLLDVTKASEGCLFTIWHWAGKFKSGFYCEANEKKKIGKPGLGNISICNIFS